MIEPAEGAEAADEHDDVEAELEPNVVGEESESLSLYHTHTHAHIQVHTCMHPYPGNCGRERCRVGPAQKHGGVTFTAAPPNKRAKRTRCRTPQVLAGLISFWDALIQGRIVSFVLGRLQALLLAPLQALRRSRAAACAGVEEEVQLWGVAWSYHSCRGGG
eukprot:SAG11_NODE_14103_length_625_cov_0.745247_1_plen_160_part_01